MVFRRRQYIETSALQLILQRFAMLPGSDLMAVRFALQARQNK
jgi:hypothetical protein